MQAELQRLAASEERRQTAAVAAQYQQGRYANFGDDLRNFQPPTQRASAASPEMAAFFNQAFDAALRGQPRPF